MKITGWQGTCGWDLPLGMPDQFRSNQVPILLPARGLPGPYQFAETPNVGVGKLSVLLTRGTVEGGRILDPIYWVRTQVGSLKQEVDQTGHPVGIVDPLWGAVEAILASWWRDQEPSGVKLLGPEAGRWPGPGEMLLLACGEVWVECCPWAHGWFTRVTAPYSHTARYHPDSTELSAIVDHLLRDRSNFSFYRRSDIPDELRYQLQLRRIRLAGERLQEFLRGLET